MLEAARKVPAFWSHLACLAQLEEQMPGHIRSLGPQRATAGTSPAYFHVSRPELERFQVGPKASKLPRLSPEAEIIRG